MGNIIDLADVRQKKKIENQKALQEAYDGFNGALSYLREKCPLVEVNKPSHPMVRRINELLGELSVIKDKAYQKVTAAKLKNGNNP